MSKRGTWHFLVIIVDTNLADGEGDVDVTGERGPCSLCWRADAKVANCQQCVHPSHFRLLTTLHFKGFSKVAPNNIFGDYGQWSFKVLWICGWIRFVLYLTISYW